MARNRLVYQNWIVELGRDPVSESTFVEIPVESELTCQIREAVEKALGRLTTEEREFLERFYYMGESYRDLSDRSGRSVHKLEALHKRAMRKLRSALACFVRAQFDLEWSSSSTCPLCLSSQRGAIDKLIASRDPRSTWRPVIQTLKARFGITVSAPTILIGHVKYH